jgi:hypothetical protein
MTRLIAFVAVAAGISAGVPGLALAEPDARQTGEVRAVYKRLASGLYADTRFAAAKHAAGRYAEVRLASGVSAASLLVELPANVDIARGDRLEVRVAPELEHDRDVLAERRDDQYVLVRVLPAALQSDTQVAGHKPAAGLGMARLPR